MSLLIAVAAIAPFSLHVITPSVPGLARAFDQDFATAQLALTLYLATVAVGQIGYGPISDFYGRRQMLIIGLCIYSVASAACAFADSIETLVAARILQALGACSGLVLSRAMVSDICPRDNAASMLGSMAAGMTVGTAVAPAVGAYLDQTMGWRAPFLALVVYGGATALFSLKFAHETLAERRAAMAAGQFLKDCASALCSRRYLAYAAHLALTTAAWFAFVASMPHYMITVLGRPIHEYGLYVTFAFAGYILGNCAAARLTVRLGGTRMIALGAVISAAGFSAIALAPQLGQDALVELFVSISIAIVGQGITVPNVTAAALCLNPRIVGTASSLLGAIQMAVSACATFIVGYAQDGTIYPLVYVVAGAGILSVLSLALLPRARRPAANSHALPLNRERSVPAHAPGGR